MEQAIVLRGECSPPEGVQAVVGCVCSPLKSRQQHDILRTQRLRLGALITHAFRLRWGVGGSRLRPRGREGRHGHCRRRGRACARRSERRNVWARCLRPPHWHKEGGGSGSRRGAWWGLWRERGRGRPHTTWDVHRHKGGGHCARQCGSGWDHSGARGRVTPRNWRRAQRYNGGSGSCLITRRPGWVCPREGRRGSAYSKRTGCPCAWGTRPPAPPWLPCPR